MTAASLARRWRFLQACQRDGRIDRLERQVGFALHVDGEKAGRQTVHHRYRTLTPAGPVEVAELVEPRDRPKRQWKLFETEYGMPLVIVKKSRLKHLPAVGPAPEAALKPPREKSEKAHRQLVRENVAEGPVPNPLAGRMPACVLDAAALLLPGFDRATLTIHGRRHNWDDIARLTNRECIERGLPQYDKNPAWVVVLCPTRYAEGAEPQRSVRGRGIDIEGLV